MKQKQQIETNSFKHEQFQLYSEKIKKMLVVDKMKKNDAKKYMLEEYQLKFSTFDLIMDQLGLRKKRNKQARSTNEKENQILETATTDEEWGKEWFKKTNELCKRCKKDCKQSSYLEIIKCPDFEEIEKT